MPIIFISCDCNCNNNNNNNNTKNNFITATQHQSVKHNCVGRRSFPTTPTSTAPTYINISTDYTYIDYVLILLTHIFVLLLRTQLNVYSAYHQVLVQCKPLYHANPSAPRATSTHKCSTHISITYIIIKKQLCLSSSFAVTATTTATVTTTTTIRITELKQQ